MPVRIELAGSARHRRRLLAGTAAAVVVAVAALALAVAGTGGGSTLLGRASLLAVAAGLVALSVLLGRAAQAPPGALVLGDEQVVVEHPELLRHPVVLPRSQVRSVLVDPQPAPPTPGLAAEHAARFPLVEAGEAAAWLHPGARPAFVHLGFQRDLPDIAVVLRQPWPLEGVPRRLLALLEGNEELRVLATCAGFFLRAADAGAAAAAASAAALDAPLTLAEANRLEDLATERRTTRP